MAFWDSWQLWEKMCFVLGTSIICVIALGGVKLGYSRWRLRKYTAIAATKEAQRKEMQHSESVRQRRAREIPFGVRAIESGIEVDGIWISRSNTPGPSVPGSPALSVSSELKSGMNGTSSERPVSTSNMPRLEMPQPAHHENLGPSPARSSTSSRPLSSSFDRAVSAEIIPSRLSSSESTSRGRATYQPRRSSHLRYSNLYDNDSSGALAALEGRQMAKTPAGSHSAGHENSSSAGSWSESSSSEGRSGYSQPSQTKTSHSLLDPADAYSRNASSSQRRALDTLPSQRRSHAAETGQLLPRGRHSGTSGDWTEATTPAEHSYNVSQHPSPYHDLRDPFATPGLDEQSQEPPSFQNFVHQALPSNRFDLIDDSESIHAQGDQNTRRAQIARKINPGFEILQPNTLDTNRQSSDIADRKQDLEAGNKRHSRRLQRKRGNSNGTESRFIEEV